MKDGSGIALLAFNDIKITRFMGGASMGSIQPSEGCSMRFVRESQRDFAQ